MSGMTVPEEVRAYADAVHQRLVGPLGAGDQRDRFSVLDSHHAAAAPQIKLPNVTLEVRFADPRRLGEVHEEALVECMDQQRHIIGATESIGDHRAGYSW